MRFNMKLEPKLSLVCFTWRKGLNFNKYTNFLPPPVNKRSDVDPGPLLDPES